MAETHLCTLGYRTLLRNYACKEGEIDLIAWHGDTLVFVEVRSQKSPQHGDPLETITRPKQLRIIAAARHFLASGQLSTPWPPMRFDAVGVILSSPPLVRVVSEAFEV